MSNWSIIIHSKTIIHEKAAFGIDFDDRGEKCLEVVGGGGELVSAFWRKTYNKFWSQLDFTYLYLAALFDEIFSFHALGPPLC